MKNIYITSEGCFVSIWQYLGVDDATNKETKK